MYFGDKNGFAIRYIPEKKYITLEGHEWLYAYLHLSINGQLIGDPTESCVALTWLNGLAGFLQRIKNGENKHAEFVNRSDEEIFELIWKSNQLEEDFDPQFTHLPQLDSSVWHCHLSLDETIDAYLITVTEQGDKLKFICKGWRRPCPKELIGKLFSATFEKDEVIKTLEECIQFVNSDFKNYEMVKAVEIPVERNERGENYLELLKQNKDLPEIMHRKIACAFARLVWNELDDFGKNALEFAEGYVDGEHSDGESELLRKQLQDLLPDNPAVSPYPPVLWALHEPSISYPSWYAASLGGMNVFELKAATNNELCAIINDFLSRNQKQ